MSAATDTTTCTYCAGEGCGECFLSDLEAPRPPIARPAPLAPAPLTVTASSGPEPEPEPEPLVLTPVQEARLASGLGMIRRGLEPVLLDEDGDPLAWPKAEDDVRAAWLRHPDALPGLVVPAGWAAVRLNDATQQLYEAYFGPLPEDVVRWEGGGYRYWLLRVGFGLASLARIHLEEGAIGSSWSGREPWLYLGATGHRPHFVTVRVPENADDPDGFVWINRSGSRSLTLPRKLTAMLYELAYANEVHLLEEYAERRDEEPAEPDLRPSDAGQEGPRLLTSEELASIPRGRELVEGFGMQPGTVALAYGAKGIGKSFLATDLAFHVAAGEEAWHGRALETGAVVYVAAEGAETLTERRLAWERHHGRPVGPTFTTYAPEKLDLSTVDGASVLARDLLRNLARPRLVVVDTVSASLPGRDENAHSTMSGLAENAKVLARRLECCVLLIHHTGKDASRGSRGHGSLEGAAPTVLAVSAQVGGKVRAQVTHNRSGREGEAVTLRLVDVAVPAGVELPPDVGPSCVLVDDTPEPTGEIRTPTTPTADPHQLVAASLRHGGGKASSKNAAAKVMAELTPGGMGKPKAYKLLDAAVEDGRVRLVGRSLELVEPSSGAADVDRGGGR